MRKLPPPKPFLNWRDGQFVEALRRPGNEQPWNVVHERMRVESQLPSFAINGEVWATREKGKNKEWIFLYEVPLVLPIRGVGNS